MEIPLALRSGMSSLQRATLPSLGRSLRDTDGSMAVASILHIIRLVSCGIHRLRGAHGEELEEIADRSQYREHGQLCGAESDLVCLPLYEALDMQRSECQAEPDRRDPTHQV